MTHIIEAVFDGQVFKPNTPPDLPPDTRYRLIIEEVSHEEVGDVWQLLKGLTGTVEAPADWAAEHNHYLYGTPKAQTDETA